MAKTELQRTGSGGAIFIDDYLSETSENPVMNKAVYAAIEALEGEIPSVPVAENVAECEAENVAGCVESINDILYALKEAGLMEADPDDGSPDEPVAPAD